MSCGIYKITCKVTCRSYVGQSKNITGSRWRRHRKRFSPEMFDYEILEEHDTYDKPVLNVREKFFIKEYCTKEPFGFNKTGGGSGNSEPCSDTKAKMSDAQKRRKHKPHKPRKKETNKRGPYEPRSDKGTARKPYKKETKPRKPYKPRSDKWKDIFEWCQENK